MKKVTRLPPPDCLNNEIEKSRRKNIDFYEKLRDSKGDIQPRWNTTCKEGGKISKIRLQLLCMSDGCCIFCGVKIDDESMDVDHYLPKKKFPYLSYCWENLLPTCKPCNQSTKGDFAPDCLKDKAVVEEVAIEQVDSAFVYNKETLLGEIAKVDRLIEPTFDNPEEHLEFNPEFCWYEGKTAIGRLTVQKFFNRHKKVGDRWEKLSQHIRILVLEDVSIDIIRSFVQLDGYEYVCWKFYDYWLEEKRMGRIKNR